MSNAPDHKCPYEALSISLSYSACITAGEWLLALVIAPTENEEEERANVEDMTIAARHFAMALTAFDAVVRDDTAARFHVEKIRRDVLDLLDADGVDAFFSRSDAKIVRAPLDATPDATPGEVRQ